MARPALPSLHRRSRGAALRSPSGAPDVIAHARPSVLRGLQWLSGYPVQWLWRDLVAGLTLAAYLVPAGIGDATLAGLQPQAGIYACVFSGLVFWAFCSSRHTVVTVTSALSLLIGASVAELSNGDPARHAALASGVALMLTAFACTAWLARAGNAVAFFSETVLIGFKSGLAFYLAVTQLPKLLGIGAGHGDFWARSADLLAHAGDTHVPSLLVGTVALAAILAGRIWLRNRPIALLVVLSGIVAAQVLQLEVYGVALLGEVPQGLPSLGIPAISRSDLNDLVPVALAALVLGTVETAAIGRMFGLKHGYRLDANRELLALGAANLLAGIGRGFPVSGGMSQSLVNESAGARTPLSGLVAALVALLVALFATGLLRHLPQPVLAAIVLGAAVGLLDIAMLRHIWLFSRGEFLVAMAAFVGVLGSGPVNGVLIGAAISIVLLLRQAAAPRVTELGRAGGTAVFADRDRHPENARVPGVLVIRCESSLLYFNVDHVRKRVFELLEGRQEPPRLLVLFLGAMPRIDLAGAELLAELHQTMRKQGIAVRLAEAHGEVRDALRRIGFEREYGPLEPGQTVDAVLRRED
jgi:sulfate permease, SulP family